MGTGSELNRFMNCVMGSNSVPVPIYATGKNYILYQPFGW